MGGCARTLEVAAWNPNFSSLFQPRPIWHCLTLIAAKKLHTSADVIAQPGVVASSNVQSNFDTENFVIPMIPQRGKIALLTEIFSSCEPTVKIWRGSTRSCRWENQRRQSSAT